jgi:hypothetical protein
MNFTSKGTREILIAGCQEHMFKVDVEKGVVVDTVRFGVQPCDRMLTRFSFPWTPNTRS